MNILINLESSVKNTTDPFHGGNEYANRIVSELINTNNLRNNLLYFLCHSEKNIESNILMKIKNDSKSFLVDNTDCRTLELAIEKYKIKKLFDPLGLNLSAQNVSNIDVIYTIHGLRPIEMPTDINEYYLESQIKHVLKRVFPKVYRKKLRASFKADIELKAKSKSLIVVSEHTKNSIITEFNVDPESINAFYSPKKIAPSFSDSDEHQFFVQHKKIEATKYFLLVSSKRWIKNTYRAIRAFDELIDQGLLKYPVVLTGSNKKVEALINNKNMFYPMGYVQSKDLEILYKNAFAFVFPSLNEGFGYPPLEAMKYNTPVIASLISSIPEVVGNAALGFNPFSIIELKARIVQMQEDNILRNNLKQNSKERYNYISLRQKKDLNKLINIILS